MAMANKTQEQKRTANLEQIHPRSLKFWSKPLRELVKGKLWLKVMVGLVFGILVGFILGPTAGLVSRQSSFILGEWLALPGIIFLGLIQMIVIPLIFASIIRGIASSSSMKQLKKTGLAIAGYFIFTTAVAITIGLVLASLIVPGQYITEETLQQSGVQEVVYPESSLDDAPSLQEIPTLIGTIIPTNVLGSTIKGEMLPVVIFAIIFGIALVSMSPSKSKPLIELLGSLQTVCLTIVKWAMKLAPLAVFGLLARLTSQFGVEALMGMSVYVATVLLGLAILLGIYLSLTWLASGITPLVFLRKIKDVQLLAFSTSSSAAVMPLTIKTAEERLNVRPSISQFVVPLGATINMDGTAIYQVIATLFIAQVFGVDLGLTALLLLIVTIVGASIGAPATPGVGMIILASILTSFGIPLAGIALIIGVDRILDMTRTAINVTGDLTASLVMNRLIPGKETAKEQLAKQRKMEERRKQIGEDVIIKKTLA
jgi:Na+/H+-dicarboxylate symporter